METRDQWYKPNLLYNIHYRPPKKPEPPKMIVETVQYNPSVCTCGEHGYQPQYRMERRVLWTNKEVGRNEQQSEVNERNKRNEQFEEIDQECRFIEDGESNQMGLNEKICEEDHIKESDASNQMGLKAEIAKKFRSIEDDDGATESFKDRKSNGVGVRKSYQASDAVKEIDNTEVESDDDGGADENKEKKKKECHCKDEVVSNDRIDYICIDEEITNTGSIRESDNSCRRDRDNFECRICEEVNGERRICNGCESAINNDCNSDGRRFEEDQIDNGHEAGEDDGAIDRSDNDHEAGEDDGAIDRSDNDHEAGEDDGAIDRGNNDHEAEEDDGGIDRSDNDHEAGEDDGAIDRSNNDHEAGEDDGGIDRSDNDHESGEDDGAIDRGNNDHEAEEDDGAIDRGDAGYVEDNYSINRILLNRCIEIADFCIPESEVKCLDGEEIASAFGIMSIYCNSGLHTSWRSFEDEDG